MKRLIHDFEMNAHVDEPVNQYTPHLFSDSLLIPDIVWLERHFPLSLEELSEIRAQIPVRHQRKCIILWN